MVPTSGNEDKPGLLEYLEVDFKTLFIIMEISIYAILGYYWIQLVCAADSGFGHHSRGYVGVKNAVVGKNEIS